MIVMIRLGTLLLLVLAAVSSPARADITRSCSANVYVFVADNKPTESELLADITGQGSCAGKHKANECRSRARSAINACLKDMWNGRQANAIPASCNNLVAGSSRSGAKLQYAGIAVIAEPNRLMARAALAACCRLRPQAGKLSISITGRISGDRNCAAHNVGKDRYQEEYGFPRYEMSCSAWRAQGICG